MRERILDTALESFNERGLENVGMRELARALGISPGNLTYHFPRKEDVVAAIMERLAQRNRATLGPPEGPTGVGAFLATYRQVFRNQYDFRCLMLALVHINETYPALHARYARTSGERRATLHAAFAHLRDTGHLRRDLTPDDRRRLVAHCSIISRFWLSESRLDGDAGPIDVVMERYLDLLAGALTPFASERGRADLAEFASAP